MRPAPPEIPLRVVKLGGSLLDWHELAAELPAWLERQTAAHHVIVVGGGSLADAVRRAQHTHHLCDEACHWLSIDAMSLATRLVAQLLPQADIYRELAPLLKYGSTGRVSLFDAGLFLRKQEASVPGTRLPHNWDVTSDSIAARVAVVLRAAELVLLKSALPAKACSLEALADAGYVDRFLPRLGGELPPIRMVNLRNADAEWFIRPAESIAPPSNAW